MSDYVKLLFLVPVSLVLGGLGLAAFLWTIRANQYEDLEGDARRILREDDAKAGGKRGTG